MFTGIVTSVGRIGWSRPRAPGLRIAVEHTASGGAIERGESVAVDGCCLTVLAPAVGRFEADLTPETLARTGGRAAWSAGRQVNLERALRAGDRLGGHLVQGHVDEQTRVVSITRRADGSARLRLELAAEFRHLVVEKGSIAVSGVSLTIAGLDRGAYEIALIPETLRATTLGRLEPGDRVNVEYDIFAKYAARALGQRSAGYPREG